MRARIETAVAVGPVHLVIVSAVEFFGARKKPQGRCWEAAGQDGVYIQYVALTGIQSVNDEAAVGSQQSLRQLTGNRRVRPGIGIREIAGDNVDAGQFGLAVEDR